MVVVASLDRKQKKLGNEKTQEQKDTQDTLKEMTYEKTS